MPLDATAKDRLRNILESGLQHLVTVPSELELAGGAASAAGTRHRLARNMVLSLLASEEHDDLATRLFATVKSACDADDFAGRALELADLSFQLLSALLREPHFLNAFDKTQALVTIYFFIVSVMLCSEVGVRTVQQHEGVVVRVALLMNRLLLNRQVYETSRSAVQCTARACAKLCSSVGKCCHRAGRE